MKKKYIAFNIAIITTALLLFFGFGISVTRSNLYDEAGRIITEITDVYVNNYTTPQNAVKHTSGDTRVTVIDSTGRVIADSVEIDVSAMENHMNREEILDAVWGIDYFGDVRAVDTLLARLRMKVKEHCAGVRFCSIYGVGYKLEERL